MQYILLAAEGKTAPHPMLRSPLNQSSILDRTCLNRDALYMVIAMRFHGTRIVREARLAYIVYSGTQALHIRDSRHMAI
jgi:hypothetical protein